MSTISVVQHDILILHMLFLVSLLLASNIYLTQNTLDLKANDSSRKRAIAQRSTQNDLP